jgi:hypothetical protein
MERRKGIRTGIMMRDRILIGASISFLISIPWLILSYLGYQITRLPVIPFKIFETIVLISPGSVITPALELMIQILHTLQIGPTSIVGKNVEIITAFVFGFAGLLLLGILYSISLDRIPLDWWSKGLIMALVLTILSIPFVDPLGLVIFRNYSGAIWLLSINMIWGLSLSWGIENTYSALAGEPKVGRSRTIAQIGIVSLAVSLLALGLERILQIEQTNDATEISSEIEIQDEITPSPNPTTPGFSAVEGTRPEITPIDDFYRVDINLLPPGQEDFARNTDEFTQRLLAQGGETDLPAETYSLIIDGLVERPLALDLNTIKSYPRVEQHATLSCISNPVGGDLIGTTLFEGVRLRDLLSEAGIEPETQKIKFTCVDGYTESLPIEVANDPTTLLCYSMGNETLTETHGAPIRLYVPGRYGMKSPKWIIKIEAIDEDYLGYWEKQGWSDEAIVKTTSVIDTVQPNPDGIAKVGGIAYSGKRGIKSVELKVNDGDWTPAEINNPLSPFTWILWRAELNLPPGESTITVRAMDGNGNTQTEEISAPHPDGASGYHDVKVEN